VPRKQSERAVFLNIPYDAQFHNLALAYISGISCFGLGPRATIEIPGSVRRLDRIIELIGGCVYSIHDLSRVQVDRNTPITPRFNMPFELGLAVAWEKLKEPSHTWFVFEARPRRLSKSLSDLDGTDPYIHGNTVEGILRQLGHALIHEEKQPSFAKMLSVYRYIHKELPTILRVSGARSIFDGGRAFRDVGLAATLRAKGLI